MIDVSKKSDVFQKLLNGAKNFSPQQRKVCLYISEHYKDAAFMTVKKMAEELDIGAATVMRTIANLGYDSYKDLTAALRSNIINLDSTYWQELRRSWEKGETDQSADILAEITRHNIVALENSYSPALIQSFEKCIDMLRVAKKISILGLRSSRTVSYNLFYLLDQFLDNVYLADAIDSAEVFSSISRLEADDVLLAFSLGGPNYASRTHDAIKYAATRDVPVILITDSPTNPSVHLASVALFIPSSPLHYSMLPAMNLVDAIVAMMGTAGNHQHMMELARTLADNDIILS